MLPNSHDTEAVTVSYGVLPDQFPKWFIIPGGTTNNYRDVDFIKLAHLSNMWGHFRSLRKTTVLVLSIILEQNELNGATAAFTRNLNEVLSDWCSAKGYRFNLRVVYKCGVTGYTCSKSDLSGEVNCLAIVHTSAVVGMFFPYRHVGII